jgi:hypothetical protein
MKRLLYVMPVMLAAASQSGGYLAAMPTLGKITVDSSNIVVLQVDKVNREKRIVVFKKVADLRGKGLPDVVKHRLTERKTGPCRVPREPCMAPFARPMSPPAFRWDSSSCLPFRGLGYNLCR